MGTYQEITGDLIELALEGEFDVIAHGCNCFCTMGAGIAPIMARNFGCDEYRLENAKYKGSILKLGQIDFESKMLLEGVIHPLLPGQSGNIFIVNAYTQHSYGSKAGPPLNYPALTLCLIKMNYLFKGMRIGLPQIGCGLAGGDWKVVSELIKLHMADCHVTVVIYDGKPTSAIHELED